MIEWIYPVGKPLVGGAIGTLCEGGPVASFPFICLNAKVKKLATGFSRGFTVIHNFLLFCWCDADMDSHASHFILWLGRSACSGRH